MSLNDLEELKSLLFGAEKETLDTLSERVQRPETRAADIAAVLPEAVRLSRGNGDALATELRAPVDQCLKKSFREEPEEYANALYPIIGPAIRKSIMQTLKSFAEQINRTMEHSLSARGLKWRMQAWRSGIPFGDFVLQQTLRYRIEQAYLISRENGLLVAHVHHDASRIKDSDAVSAMFTAIQDFVKESFSPDRTGRLETADMGEFTLWAVHGPHALMVCVIRGVPPRSLRADLSSILERIHFRYADAIRQYAGDTATVQGVEEELDDCLEFEAQQPAEKKKRRLSTPLLIFLLVALAGIAYAAYARWVNMQQYQRLEQVTATAPGFYVGGIQRDGGVFTLHGLRDPLAADVDEIAAQSELDPHQVVSKLRPYRSLDPEIVLLRSRSILDPAETVALELAAGAILVSGEAPQQWINALHTKIDANVVGMPVVIDDLASSEMLALASAVDDANGTRFLFADSDRLSTVDQGRLQAYATKLDSIVSDADELDVTVTIRIVGATDRVGNTAFNTTLAERRVEVAAKALRDAGVDAVLISSSIDVPSEAAEQQDAARRRVTIEVALAAE